MIDGLEGFDEDIDYSERIAEDFQWWLRTNGQADKASRLLYRLLKQSQRQQGYVDGKSPATQMSEAAELILALELRERLEEALDQLEAVMGTDAELVWIRERWGTGRTLQVGAEFATNAIERGLAEPAKRPSWWRRLMGRK